MKVLYLTSHYDNIHLAYAMAREGHSIYVHSPYDAGIGEGLVNNVKSWRPEFRSSDLIIFDGAFHSYETVFRDAGKTILNCSVPMHTLSRSHTAMMKVFVALTIPHPEWWSGDAIDLEQLEFPHIYQLMADGVSTIVETRSQLNWFLSAYKPNELIIHREMPGFDLTIDGIFNGRDWINPFLVTGFNQDTINSCVEGAITFAVESCSLTRQTIEPFSDQLRKVSYRGMLSIHCRVDQSQLWVDNFSVGFSPLVTEALVEGTLGREKVFDMLFEIAGGFKKTIDFTKDNVISVPIRIADFTSTAYRGYPIEFSETECLPHVHFSDVSFKDNQYSVYNAVRVGVVTARGRTVSEARSRVYRTISNIRIPELAYRRDVGKSQDAIKTELTHWKLI